jgi:hypothetical protein
MALLAFKPVDLAGFALSEFERGLEGLTEHEACARMKKADGTMMNSIAHTVGHIAGHWLLVRRYATGQSAPSGLRPFAFGAPPEETPPPFDTVLGFLSEARNLDWLAEVDDSFLNAGDRPENVGASVTRVMLHTWFHIGEINAIRQMLGHAEIAFVGDMLPRLAPVAVTRAE